jgi:hypothetical protein
VFAVAKLVAECLPEAAFAQVFCKVPAWLAAVYFQTPLQGETLLFGSGATVVVSRACGGADFFAMLCAVLAWHAVAHREREHKHQHESGRRRATLNAIVVFGLIFPIAWAATLLVNGARVIAVVWVRAGADALLPERFAAAAHLAAGVLVFFPALAAAWWLCERRSTGATGSTGVPPSPATGRRL